MATKIDLCPQCNATGLAMFIALILPTPNGCGSPALPGWVSALNVISIALTGYQYSLRSVRAGYVYVFFKKNSRGRNRWQAWDVSTDGQMYPMANPAWAIPVADVMCRRTGHSAARLHHIVIEDPHMSETAWIAFSEKQWSDDTIKRYTEDETLRGERMLKFEPAQLIASDSASGSSITPANVAALEAICDYAPSFDTAKLPFGSEQAKPAKISTGEGGGFEQNKLAFQSTRYPWPAGRKGTAAKACDMLMLRSRKKDGTPHPGVVVALPDAVGCTLEVNGYRNDVPGRIAQYGQERALQITAINDVDGLKIALRQRTQDAIDQPWEWDTARSATRLKGARSAGVSAEQMAREEDLCRRWEEDARARAPRMYAQQRSFNVARDKYTYDKDQARIDASLAKRQKNITSPEVAAKRSAFVENAMASTWPTYEDRIDRNAIEQFKLRWGQLLTAADKLVEQRTEALVKWLEAPAFLVALEDYAPTNTDDGVMFEDLIGSAIVGMGSSKAGRNKIDAWVKEMQASKGNLLWRAVAQNNKEAMAEVTAALKHAYAAPTPLTTKAWELAAKDVKWNKVADIGKKSLTFFNTNMKAVNDAASGIAAVERTLGLDLILSTTGYRLLKPLAATGDTVNELMLQTFLAVRGGAEPSAALALAESQSRYQTLEREAFIQRLRDEQHHLSEAAKARQAELSARWKALRGSADVADSKKGNFNAARDARIALVVALFEGFNLYKTAGKFSDDPKDAKLKMQLNGAMLAMGSSVTDVVSNLVKGVADAKDKAVSYQALKLGGGALSVVASAYGAMVDWEGVKRTWSADDYRAVVTIGTRGVFQVLSGLLRSRVEIK